GDGFHGEGVTCVPQDCTTVECPPVATPTPTPTLSPTPTPTVPRTPTPTPTSTGTCLSSPTPTPTAIARSATFTNFTGQVASDLHIRYNDEVSGLCVASNAPGCPAPSTTGVFIPSRATWGFDIDWGTDCVDSGESVTIHFGSHHDYAQLTCMN